jgi:hypothetical protein
MIKFKDYLDGEINEKIKPKICDIIKAKCDVKNMTIEGHHQDSMGKRTLEIGEEIFLDQFNDNFNTKQAGWNYILKVKVAGLTSDEVELFNKDKKWNFFVGEEWATYWFYGKSFSEEEPKKEFGDCLPNEVFTYWGEKDAFRFAEKGTIEIKLKDAKTDILDAFEAEFPDEKWKIKVATKGSTGWKLEVYMDKYIFTEFEFRLQYGDVISGHDTYGDNPIFINNNWKKNLSDFMVKNRQDFLDFIEEE